MVRCLFIIVQTLLESRNAAGKRCTGTIGTAHCLNILRFFCLVIDIDIHVSDTLCHPGIHHLDKVIDHLLVIHTKFPHVES